MAKQTTTFVPKLSIEAIQTVTPMALTEPRQTRQVLAGEVVDPGIFQRCLNMVQYYKKETEEDSGWLHAGWFKDTLGRALMVQPMISGRLRKREKEQGELEIVANDSGIRLKEQGELEIVANDSGIRLIEARMEMNLSEFLDLKQKEDVEPHLVFWKDIDQQNPHFSPLFYVQVTNFKCGGYAIGISCSILLTDLLLKKEFLKTWADIHNHIINKNNEQKLPLFYLPGFKNTTNFSSPNLITSSSSTNAAKTMIFKTKPQTESLESERCRKMALACVEEAQNILGYAMGSDQFSLFVNESHEAIKIESCSKQGMSNSKAEWLNRAKWDDLGVNEVSFGYGNKPALVSYWLRSMLGGFVLLIPSLEEDTYTVNIIVTIPNQKSG